MRLSRTLTAPDYPENLAIFRIVLCTTLIAFCPPRFPQMNALPAELRIAPPGLELLMPFIPVSHSVPYLILGVFLLACMCGVLGLFSRTSCAIAVLTGLYVYGVPQLFGKIDHNHHLLWLTALLACSRCGDALSIDAWLSRKRYQPSVIYAIPIRFAWALLGLTYFMPGYWKLVGPGWEWALSDNIRNAMYTKWFEIGGYVPPFAIDQYPLLYRSFGIAIMLFELTFIIGIFIPRWRWIWIVGGLTFHWSVAQLMTIKFWKITWCYPVFVDWHAIYAKLGIPERFSRIEPPRSASVPILIVGTLLVCINMLYGFMKIDSWPFTVYPTFAALQDDVVDTVVVKARTPHGDVLVSSKQFVSILGDTPRWWTMQKRMMRERDPARLREYCDGMAVAIRRMYAAYVHADIEFIYEQRSVLPDKQNDPPLQTRSLCVVPAL